MRNRGLHPTMTLCLTPRARGTDRPAQPHFLLQLTLLSGCQLLVLPTIGSLVRVPVRQWTRHFAPLDLHRRESYNVKHSTWVFLCSQFGSVSNDSFDTFIAKHGFLSYL
jgi:hypothetical protein